jgi:hypothetical protein
METKQCPFCGEEVLAIAQKCKHCGEWLAKAKEQVPCPVCGEQIEKDSEICPVCKETLIKQPDVTPPSGLDNWLQDAYLLNLIYYVLIWCSIVSLVHSWGIYSLDDAKDFFGRGRLSYLSGFLGYVPGWLETIVSTGLWVFFWLALKKCSSRFSFYKPTLFNLVCAGEIALGFFSLISELSPEDDTGGLAVISGIILLAYIVLCAILGGYLLKQKDEDEDEDANIYWTGIMLIVYLAVFFVVGIIIAIAGEEADAPWWTSCIFTLLEIGLLYFMRKLFLETYQEEENNTGENEA